MAARDAARYLYVSPRFDRMALLASDALDGTAERRHLVLDTGDALPAENPLDAIKSRPDIRGVVIGSTCGVLDRRRLDILASALRRGLRAWLYWPDERAVEGVDWERLQSLRRHRRAAIALEKAGRHAHRVMTCWERLRPGLRWIYWGAFPVRRRDLLQELDRLIADAREVPFRSFDRPPDPSRKIDAGMYLRTDFWAPIISGGSYGHTCYVAKELSAITERFVCLLVQPFELLDDFGLAHVVMEAPSALVDEDAIVTATARYYPLVKTACQVLRPSYIYERLCLGNHVAAMLSRELSIPYIIEYNGSEISMQRSGTASRFLYKDFYLKAEEAAFRQATIISVISEHVRNELVSRGVDARKILVNPNGADLDGYGPAGADDKRRLRASLGFSDRDRVIGFTGTFGGWQGTDVLAAAIPRVCAADEHARFLIVGDGPHKPQLDAEVERHRLEGRVARVGRVRQADGARLLQACDIYVSPHNTHVINNRFFGSPTKIFEYMAMGGGIVASDLEQIGEVLSPALRVGDLVRPDLTIGHERSVLCAPGDVDEFVCGVIGLVRRPDIACALGRNARQAVADDYSWRRHIERLWTFAAALSQDNRNSPRLEARPRAKRHTREWFLEAERDRYQKHAPWMPELMEFAAHAGEQVLGIGGGGGTDLAQFAAHGAIVTGVDRREDQLHLAERNFFLRGLTGRFVHHEAESLPFDDGAFDLVYMNGAIHQLPDAAHAISEIRRVLKPGGRLIAVVYAERSLQYWRNLVWHHGVKNGELATRSMADIMSRSIDRTGLDGLPVVAVYTRARLRKLFAGFDRVRIVQRQIGPELVPRRLRWLRAVIERMAGWNLIVKATKP